MTGTQGCRVILCFQATKQKAPGRGLRYEAPAGGRDVGGGPANRPR